MDQVEQVFRPLQDFAKDSMRLVKRCTKPDMKGRSVRKCMCEREKMSFFGFFTEFQRIALATAIGFAVMGFIGFFVKLIHIPINNIIV